MAGCCSALEQRRNLVYGVQGLWRLLFGRRLCRQQLPVVVSHQGPKIMSSCDHFWNPVLGWPGRYRCSDCAAFGYRVSIIIPEESRGRRSRSAIVPYRCSKKGCKRPAIGKDPLSEKGTWYRNMRRWRCSAHRGPEKFRKGNR